MGILSRKSTWYAAGLAFECHQCGRCCAGPEEGYVWVQNEDIAAIAKFLGISEQQMRRQYVRNVSGSQSLKEQSDTKDCVFLKPNGNGAKGCSVYPVRPVQCRTWPFWPSNLSRPDAWALTQFRCPGINRGPIHPCEEIEARRDATRE